MIRLFAALAVPDDIAAELAPRQTGLPGARWSPPENLHLTLRFFGDLDERAAEDLDIELARIDVPAFELQLSGAGSFGDDRRARAVWAGLKPSEPLARLAAKCETAARRAGLEPSHRAYSPHVTLAYVQRAEPGRVASWTALNAMLSSRPFRVERFGLYSSVLGAAGPHYEIERSYRLG
ncbi:MAG TPA: RNA 2',3'-cyclic phosphodiesterase [Caulobacteraceae bacterium]